MYMIYIFVPFVPFCGHYKFISLLLKSVNYQMKDADNWIFFYSFFDKHAGDYIANEVWKKKAYQGVFHLLNHLIRRI